MSEHGQYVDYDNWDDMQDRARLAEAKANKTVTPKQREIVYGSYWIRAASNGILEYGYVIPQQEAEAKQTAETVRALRDMYARGYRWSRAHSVLSTEGELGDAHLAVLWPITEGEFRKAETTGFRSQGSADWETEMLARITEEMRDSLAVSSQPSAPAPPQKPSQLRLVKLQVATKQHECVECPEDPIEPGERYMRVAIPPSEEAFPDASDVAQEDAWQYVGRDWTIEKTHELCYALRYFKPGASRG